MSITLILSLLLTHWVADFVFQDEVWANNKSTSNTALLKHTLTYSTVFTIIIGIWTIYLESSSMFTALPLLFPYLLITHTIIDYFTSRKVSKLFKANHYGSSIPNTGAFTYIGLDQYLHYATIFIYFDILTL